MKFFKFKVIVGAILVVVALSSCGSFSSPSKIVVPSKEKYVDQRSLIKHRGVPAEIILLPQTRKDGDYVVLWVYYVQQVKDDSNVYVDFFSFRGGKCIGTNAGFSADSNEPERILDVNNINDYRMIISERDSIRGLWGDRLLSFYGTKGFKGFGD